MFLQNVCRMTGLINRGEIALTDGMDKIEGDLNVLLSSHQQELAARIEGMKVKETEMDENDYTDSPDYVSRGYNSAVDDVLSIINQSNKE